jgi:hypothetical protein
MKQKGRQPKQLTMDAALAEAEYLDKEAKRRQWARERIVTDAIRDRLNEKYKRLDRRACDRGEIPAGTVVIIGQVLFRDEHYTMHFYRAILGYHSSLANPTTPHFIESQTEEWPDVPPWAHVIGHENEARDIELSLSLEYWDTGETVEPIKTWWMIKEEETIAKFKRWEEERRK